ncbi:MAG TPA: hypothetical protein VFE78_17365 [Gemmataceae bacterium]|jgi:uncharacterized protein (TIGR03066 family)|nr:hypothetical protein [Gemmataceae bacterium]
MRVSRLALVAVALLAVPACSFNRGKIVGKWESTGGNALPPGGRMTLEFTSGGQVTMSVFVTGGSLTVSGKYSLGMFNSVTLYDLSQAVSGRTKHVETVTISGDQLTMKDSDGKSVTFKRVK